MCVCYSYVWLYNLCFFFWCNMWVYIFFLKIWKFYDFIEVFSGNFYLFIYWMKIYIVFILSGDKYLFNVLELFVGFFDKFFVFVI